MALVAMKGISGIPLCKYIRSMVLFAAQTELKTYALKATETSSTDVISLRDRNGVKV